MSYIARLKRAAITDNTEINSFPADELINILSSSPNIKFVVLYVDLLTPYIVLRYESHDYDTGEK